MSLSWTSAFGIDIDVGADIAVAIATGVDRGIDIDIDTDTGIDQLTHLHPVSVSAVPPLRAAMRGKTANGGRTASKPHLRLNHHLRTFICTVAVLFAESMPSAYAIGLASA